MSATVVQLRRPVRSHVTNLHPSTHQPTVQPELFDRVEHPDRPVLPMSVDIALNRLAHSIRVPGTFTREQQLAALEVVAAWRNGDPTPSDDCDPSGIERPS